MKIFPNQKVITINKAAADKTNLYAIINRERLITALKELTHNELKVYLFLNSNQNGYEIALSTKDLAEQVGADKSRIQGAIRGLIDKGYLVCSHDNKYSFYE